MGKNKRMMSLPILTVMEYINGESIFSFDLKLLVDENQNLSNLGKKICIQIGNLVIFDALINNWDRIPAIWDNEGNFGNFLISKTQGLISIDSTISSIANLQSSQCEVYLEKVRKLLFEVENFEKLKPQELKYISKIRDFFKMNVNFDVGDEGMKLIRQGMADTIKKK